MKTALFSLELIAKRRTVVRFWAAKDPGKVPYQLGILWDDKHKSISVEIDRAKKENDNMQIELRLFHWFAMSTTLSQKKFSLLRRIHGSSRHHMCHRATSSQLDINKSWFSH